MVVVVVEVVVVVLLLLTVLEGLAMEGGLLVVGSLVVIGMLVGLHEAKEGSVRWMVIWQAGERPMQLEGTCLISGCS